MKKTCPISCKQLIKQAVSDWFGKEVQTGYTVTYVWMANQLGHFTLGFLFTFLIVWIVTLFNPNVSPSGPLLWVPIGEFLFWSFKEIRDYIVAVKLNKKNKVFPGNNLDIALDAGTAVLFISFGIASSYLSFLGHQYALMALAATLILGMFPARYWMFRKMCFQQADLPYQNRLSSFHVKIGKEKVKQIEDFINLDDNSWKHLLIFGKKEAEKTSLAIGIGTELAFKKGTVRYTTYDKFLPLVQEPTKSLVKQDGKVLWNWNTVDLLIIDDVNPVSENQDLIEPAEVKESILVLNEVLRKELESRKTVWVLGLTDDYNEAFVQDWKTMFEEALRVDAESIGTIVL